MIINKQPVTMAEVAKIVKAIDEKKPIHGYLKKFCKTSEADAKKLKEEVAALNNPKFKEEHYIKIADFIPKDIEDLGKVVNDVSLSEQESNAVLEITKKY